MLLPKRIIKEYTYNENDVFFTTCSSNQIDDLIINLFINNNYAARINIKTDLTFNNSYKVKHILDTGGLKTNMSDEEYKKYLKICFFKLGYHILNIVEKIDNDGNINYELELCPLIRKKTNQLRTLKNASVNKKS